MHNQIEVATVWAGKQIYFTLSDGFSLEFEIAGHKVILDLMVGFLKIDVIAVIGTIFNISITTISLYLFAFDVDTGDT